MFNKFCVTLVSNSAQAQIGEGNYPNHLFAQYTTQGQGGLTAGKYIAPHPIPSHVGHSYRTYEPLMPHEMLYEHDRSYFNYYNPSLLNNNYISKLQYAFAQRAYGLPGDSAVNIGGGQVIDKLKSKCAGGGCVRNRLGGRVAGCSSCLGN